MAIQRIYYTSTKFGDGYAVREGVDVNGHTQYEIGFVDAVARSIARKNGWVAPAIGVDSWGHSGDTAHVQMTFTSRRRPREVVAEGYVYVIQPR